jgi:hypothetical protein
MKGQEKYHGEIGNKGIKVTKERKKGFGHSIFADRSAVFAIIV